MSALLRACGDLYNFTERLASFINSSIVHQITGGIHVNDALIHDGWGSLPSEWTTYWDSLPDHRIAQQHLIDSINEECQACRQEKDAPGPPHSLQKWLEELASVSLPRRQHLGPKIELPETLTLPMKSKKIEEVADAAAYIYEVCQRDGITHIIDMGSGQGYLSVTLAYLFPSLRILAIDGSESQIAGSKAFATSLGIAEDKLRHLIRYIDGSTPLLDEIASWANGQRCLLTGLHACGRLSEHMVRYFTLCPFITQLAAVGCCYNHIIPRSDTCPEGFPISERMRGLNVTLSPTALMTGCQAPNNWQKPDPTAKSSPYSRKQFYRALLEKLFHDQGINVHQTHSEIASAEGEEAGNKTTRSERSDGLSTGSAANSQPQPNWGIRKGDLAAFEKFARRAMSCLGLSPNRISTEDMDLYEERFKGFEGRIAILWTLSVLCCKAVESVIALDRYWFLVEHDAGHVDVVPIFNYRVSPRNLMIVARKPWSAEGYRPETSEVPNGVKTPLSSTKAS